ncbi:kinesin-like protein KIF19 isoform X2 [Protopterus annectens]|uniref:kinesin-like protein KIF19 isoform X2 n=1 Tax=Protopterus annectens TaxID=7888 RepID=UPI001CF9396F|nr:kinesin-like protein KIF19 isoform X2 [Protopterus annectens]
MKGGGDSKDQQLTVALRIRPISQMELEEDATIIAHRVDGQVVVLMDPMEDPDDILRAHRSREKSYIFDVAFDYAATQEEVYRSTTKGLIEGVISGYNATVFAYGPTGCGKTYTMLGTDYEPGIYVRTLNDLFNSIEETSDNMEYEVSMSYIEIYNEMIRDLLNPSLGVLDLREDSKGVIQVAGITEVSTINAKEIMQLLMKGNKQRTQEPTAANKTSSRSHAVLQVTVKQKSRVKNIMQEIRVGRLFMIDLAGSERASQTQNRGQRMKEGAHINRSLLALGNCINALSEKGGTKYVNYRDSKLTRLLKDSLGGNSRTVMIAHISPASTAFEESRNTLTYADRAKNIKTRVKRNMLNVSYHIAQYTNIIADLRSEIHRLQKKIDEQALRHSKNEKADIRNVQAEVQLHNSHFDRQEMNRLREQLIGAFEKQMAVRRSLMELENNYMEIQIELSRHFLTIADWEQEKMQTIKKWREEMRRETFKDDSEKESDTSDDQPDVIEPQEVYAARHRIAALITEQKNMRKQKVELEKKFREIRQQAQQLEEVLPKRINSEEQQEVLSLLCKVHELEIENTEMQSNALLKDNVIRQKNYVVQRYEQHRYLCDEIIQQQRKIIKDHNLVIPRQLEDLFDIYFRELQEGRLERIVTIDKVELKSLKETSLPRIPIQLKRGDLVQDTDSDQDSNKIYGSENLQRKLSQWNTLPPLVRDSESDNNKVFTTSPRSRQIKNSTVIIPPPIHIIGMVNQKARQRGLHSYSNLTHNTGNHFTSSPESSENFSDNHLTRKERKQILTSTKNIAVKAARRRSKVLDGDAHLPLPEAVKEKSTLSLHSLSETEDIVSHGILSYKLQASPVLQHAASEDNLSTSTGETMSHEARMHSNSPSIWPQTQKKVNKKIDRRDDSLEAKRKKRRSRSFEVAGHGVLQARNNLTRYHPSESTSDHKLYMNRRVAANIRQPEKTVFPVAKVRLPQTDKAGSVTAASDSSGGSLNLNYPANGKRTIPPRLRLTYTTVNNTNAPGKDLHSTKY